MLPLLLGAAVLVVFGLGGVVAWLVLEAGADEGPHAVPLEPRQRATTGAQPSQEAGSPPRGETATQQGSVATGAEVNDDVTSADEIQDSAEQPEQITEMASPSPTRMRRRGRTRGRGRSGMLSLDDF